MSQTLEDLIQQFARTLAKEIARELREIPATTPAIPVTPVSHDPILITSTEAAKLLSISPRKLWELTNSNQIPFLHIGRSVRFDVEELRRWVKTCPPLDFTQRVPKMRSDAGPTHQAATRSKASAAKRNLSEASPKTPFEEPKSQTRSIRKFFARRLGIESSEVPLMNNRKWMMILQVDVTTLHSWIHFGQELPHEAVERGDQYLRKVLQLVSSDGT